MTEGQLLLFPDPEINGDTWQVGYVRFPAWEDDQDPPYRPVLAMAASAETGLIASSDLAHPEDTGPELAQSAVASLAETMGRRPAAIEVDDTVLVDALQTATACWRPSAASARATRSRNN
jgi:hypothetical protein